MNLFDWWEMHSRTQRNIVVVVVLDVLLLLGALLSGYPQLFSALANSLFNFYEPMFRELIAIIYGLPPTTGAGGAALQLSAELLTVVTFHVLVALLVGWLLRNKANTPLWRICNYLLLVLLLLAAHISGTFLQA